MSPQLHLKPIFILCVYNKDKPEFVSVAIESCLNQSVDCSIYIYVDGKIDPVLDKCIESYSLYDSISIFRGEDNKGLAFGLNLLIDQCLSTDAEYIFRMDADDISTRDRVEQQINFLCNNPNIDIVGSDVIEIDEQGNECFYKRMEPDSKELYKNIIKKCPLNHPSTAFRRVFFEQGLRYKEDLKNTQDYYLWVDALSHGFNISNINSPLLYFRVDEDFHQRRGFKKALNDLNARLYAFKKLDVNTMSNYVHTILLVTLRLSPSFVKKYVYKRFR